MESSPARVEAQGRWRAKQVIAQPLSDSTMVVLSGRRAFEITTEGPLDPSAAWGLLREGNSPPAVAAALGCDPALVGAFVDRLHGAGLLVLDDEARLEDGGLTVKREAAVKLIGDSATMWKRHSLTHPLFSLLEDGTRRPALALALLVETCHYARQFPLSIARAAGSLNPPRAAAALLSFAEEEMPHHESMAGSIASHLELPVEDVLGSRPSPAMQLLLAFLDQVAGADATALAAVLALVEMNDAPAELSANAFLGLADSNGLPRELFAPFGEHAREDDALDHGQVAAQVVAAALPEEVSSARLDQILNVVHDVKHGFDLVYDQLVSRWSAAEQVYRLRGSVKWKLL